jgi:type II secretory pathway component PulK
VTDDDGYYAGLNSPYPRKGADLDTVDELLLVRYFDAGKVRRLQEFVRVVGDEPINLNSASAEVLYAWQFNSLNAPEYLDRQEIAAIVDYRQQAPLETRGDLNRVPGINPNWSVALPESLVKVTGDYYQVTSSGRINQGIRRAEAVIQKNGNIQSLKVE